MKKKLNLFDLAEEVTKDQLKSIKGGTCSSCGCYWEGMCGGSMSSENSAANSSSLTSITPPWWNESGCGHG